MVEESSSLVLSLLQGESEGQSLSERVRRMSERALHNGLECSGRTQHRWLSQALKGGAGPAHPWCGKEDALSDLPLAIMDSHGALTWTRSVWREHDPQERKREQGGEDTIGFNTEIRSIRALRETRVQESRARASNLDLRAGNPRKACLFNFWSRTLWVCQPCVADVISPFQKRDKAAHQRFHRHFGLQEDWFSYIFLPCDEHINTSV